jgi:hypothetical protein
MVRLDGRKIARLRLSRGLASQRALAEETRRHDPEGSGIGCRLVWDAENGKAVSPRTRCLIAKALAVNPAELTVASRVERFARFLRSSGFTLIGPTTAIVALSVISLRLGAGYSNQPVDPTRAGPGVPPVTISDVRFSGSSDNYTMEIRGAGFGASPFSHPFYGTAPYLRVGDVSERFEAGYTGDTSAVLYRYWSNHRVIVTRLEARPGNCISLALWNPQSHVGATWGGYIPPRLFPAPRIVTASVWANGKIVIVGTGFGYSPETLPFESNDNFVVVSDAAYHPWGDTQSLPFTVGGKAMATKLRVGVWSPTLIIIDGLGGPPLPKGMRIERGDPIGLVLWSQQNNHAIAWGGVAR